MDCFRHKRRRKKEELAQQKFRQLTPHTSPVHSQPSSISQASHPVHLPPPDQPPRLPKVGSYGLWVGAPGIFASTPSPAYAYGGGGRSGEKGHPLMQPAVMQKASSDPRMFHSRGPGVYSAGGSQQRIYHSQGIPSPLSPVYEIRDPKDGSLYDVYQIGGGSTTRLLQDSSSKSIKRGLQRSQSDAVSEPTRRAYRTKPSPGELRASRTSSSYKETSPGSTAREDITANNKHNTDSSLDKDSSQKGGLENPIFIESVDKIVQEDKVAMVASATDSMKLLAKNKTDDQKTVGQSPSSSENRHNGVPSETVPSPSASGNNRSVSVNVSSTSPDPTVVPEPASPTLHYSYQGDIYAVPDKEAIRSRSTSSDVSSPVVVTVVSERSTAAVERPTTDPVTDITETTARSLRVDDDSGYAAPPIIRNPIYQEVGEALDYEPSLNHSSIYEEVGNFVRRSDDMTVLSKSSVAHSEVVSTAGGAVETRGAARVSSNEVAAAASAVSSAGDVGASGQTEEQTGVVRRQLQEQWSFESEGTSDDLTRAGKHISVTAEAFEFLDTYLSDEDGGDVNSPPTSPNMTGRSEVM